MGKSSRSLSNSKRKSKQTGIKWRSLLWPFVVLMQSMMVVCVNIWQHLLDTWRGLFSKGLPRVNTESSLSSLDEDSDEEITFIEAKCREGEFLMYSRGFILGFQEEYTKKPKDMVGLDSINDERPRRKHWNSPGNPNYPGASPNLSFWSSSPPNKRTSGYSGHRRPSPNRRGRNGKLPPLSDLRVDPKANRSEVVEGKSFGEGHVYISRSHSVPDNLADEGK